MTKTRKKKKPGKKPHAASVFESLVNFEHVVLQKNKTKQNKTKQNKNKTKQNKKTKTKQKQENKNKKKKKGDEFLLFLSAFS